ncbi:uncharacterized protein LOC143235900 [Tachypleus tridentatus]|uniref:uncharacterized protein LOC143235868 n=1 Tax=Tachypleus tridentatus TaxID=6853 RepID=UPI003FD38A8E
MFLKMTSSLLSTLTLILATAMFTGAEDTVLTLPLPENTNLVLGPVSTPFTCRGREYGYYNDPNAACKIYHICKPYISADGQQMFAHYSFYCMNDTIFDEAKVECTSLKEATPCPTVETLDVHASTDAKSKRIGNAP